MLAAIGDDEVVQPQQGGSRLQQQQQQRPGKVQLGDFWPQAPNAWFAAAKLEFEVANITREQERFAQAVGAMGFNLLHAVMDLVENPPAVSPYTTPGLRPPAHPSAEGYQGPASHGQQQPAAVGVFGISSGVLPTR